MGPTTDPILHALVLGRCDGEVVGSFGESAVQVMAILSEEHGGRIGVAIDNAHALPARVLCRRAQELDGALGLLFSRRPLVGAMLDVCLAERRTMSSRELAGIVQQPHGTVLAAWQSLEAAFGRVPEARELATIAWFLIREYGWVYQKLPLRTLPAHHRYYDIALALARGETTKELARNARVKTVDRFVGRAVEWAGARSRVHLALMAAGGVRSEIAPQVQQIRTAIDLCILHAEPRRRRGLAQLVALLRRPEALTRPAYVIARELQREERWVWGCAHEMSSCYPLTEQPFRRMLFWNQMVEHFGYPDSL